MTAAVSSVGVVGGGTMGVGIAYVFAVAGWATTVVEPDPARARAMRRTLREVARDGVRRGKLDAAHADALADSVHEVRSVAELASELDVVVESVPERLELKRQVLAQIAARAPSLLATNTSALSIDSLAEVVERPERFLGLHFFNPVWSSQMVEIVRGAGTDDDALAHARQVVATIGRESIVVRDVPGFATSRLDMVTALEAMRMLEDSVASAEDIDRAMRLAYRHPIGPLRLSDVVGLDVRLDIGRHLAVTYGARFEPPAILIAKVDAGDLGQKTGRGFFDWP